MTQMRQDSRSDTASGRRAPQTARRDTASRRGAPFSSGCSPPLPRPSLERGRPEVVGLRLDPVGHLDRVPVGVELDPYLPQRGIELLRLLRFVLLEVLVLGLVLSVRGRQRSVLRLPPLLLRVPAVDRVLRLEPVL